MTGPKTGGRSVTAEAEFLFGDDIPLYIDEIFVHGMQLREANTEYRDITQPTPPPEYDHAKVVRVITEQSNWFADQMEVAAGKFKKYLYIASRNETKIGIVPSGNWKNPLIIALLVIIALMLWGSNRKASVKQSATSASDPRASLSQQKACADQAGASFKESGFADDKTSMGNTYTDHYDPQKNICFIEVTTRHMDAKDKKISYHHLIYDAFEGRSYGEFMSISGIPPSILMCTVKADGQTETKCESSDQFDALALKFFGTGPE